MRAILALMYDVCPCFSQLVRRSRLCSPRVSFPFTVNPSRQVGSIFPKVFLKFQIFKQTVSRATVGSWRSSNTKHNDFVSLKKKIRNIFAADRK